MKARLLAWGPWVLLAVAVVAALSIGATRSSTPSLQERTMKVASQVRCPVCVGQTAAQSETPVAAQIRTDISQELRAGESVQHILDGLVASYGPSILERPSSSGVDLTVWILPIVAGVAGVGGLTWAFWRWHRRESPVEAESASVEVEL